MTHRAPTDLVVLVGHGTRLEHGQAEFRAFVELAARRLPTRVEAGFIEFADPTLADAADAAARSGARRITVAPVVLVGAGHLKDDAASVAARIRALAPDADVRLAPQLGASNELLELAVRRARAVSPMPPEAVLVVGRGSTDPSANAELAAIARLVGERLGVDLVEEAFVSLAQPSVGEGVERLWRLGARSVLLVPWWLFAGVLLERAEQEATERASALGLDLQVAERFGPDPAVLDAVWYGIEDAWRQVRSSCDTCRWRPPFSPPPPIADHGDLRRIEIGIDTPDPGRAAAFWARLLGYRIGDLDSTGTYLDLVAPDGSLPPVFLQRIETADPRANRVHLDLYGASRETLRERALALGAEERSDRREGVDGGAWCVLADPDGVQFCVMQDEPEAD
ncbi:cobalamin (vitamin B12) biosynthesis CbiX protein [Acidimicrobium ferrooxidans DSM 10331]|uniref:Cobalamin (Vitamin B12) biosynthesis CbiX protein n=1 Tax=Acidimicrobium ferrooxidans (strain DSM 10331 / JCM 15462 / NBRC 103882 / ICP) TaxID=525909 RepID=C7LYD9_ACIFD|nr:CbiX/SirB N-terminal domain-containing protein [Acidimicrobium ferrooxidans]ACU53747.1 cobalamin (vitamin B12) biosynthesis CbiX protein [Acidimicrobium ferrooxidans DSM 10331]